MRISLALATIGLLAAAAWAWNADDSALAGILARVGAVLASIWIAYPSLVKVDKRTIWLLVLGGLVVLLRPRSALVILPVLAIFVRTAKVRDRPVDR
ncbi:MAG: hypothetical protein WD990_08115 [Acidimicrobiia bacterium]